MDLKVKKQEIKDKVNYLLFNYLDFGLDKLKKSNKIIDNIAEGKDEITININ